MANKKLFAQTAIALALATAPVAASAADTTINGVNETNAQSAAANDDDLFVQNGGDLTVNGVAWTAGANTNVGVFVNTGDASKGIKSTGAVALDYTNAGSSINAIQVTSGRITSTATSSTINIAGAADSYTISTATGSAINNEGNGGEIIAISGANGNQTATITNAGSMTGTNDAGTIGIRLSDTDGGSSLNITNTGSLTTGALATAIGVETSNGTNGGNDLTLANSGTITGAITGGVDALDGMSITQTGAGQITGAVSATAGDLDINMSGTSKITGTVTLGTNTSSSVTLASGTNITGNIVLGAAGQTVSITSADVDGNITTTSDGNGNVTFGSSYTTESGEGLGVLTTGTLGTVTVGTGFTLNVDTNDTTLAATTINLNGAGSTLTLGSGDFEGAVTSGSAGEGVLNINNTGTTVTVGNIGAGNQLDQVNIVAGGTLNAATNNNSIAADAITLGNASVLTLGTGALNGVTNGAGTINFNGSQTLGAATTIGQATGLTAINVANGVTVNAAANNNAIKATDIILLGNGNLSTGSGLLTGNTQINTGTLTLGTGGYSGTIDGDDAVEGNLVFNGNQTTGGVIGGTNALTAITVNDGFTLTMDDNVSATTFTIGSAATGAVTHSAGTLTATNIDMESGATYTLSGTADFVGTIDGQGGAQGGTVIFDKDFTTSGTKVLGGADGLTEVTIATGRTLTAGGNIKAATVELSGTGTLALGNTARTVTGDINMTSGAAGNGTLNLGNAAHTLTGTLTTGANDIITTNISSVTGGTTFATAGKLSAGTITNDAGTKLNINIDANAGRINNGATYTVLDGAGATNLTGNGAALINLDSTGTNSTGVLTATTSVAGGDLIVTFARTDYADISTSTQADSVGNAVDAIGDANAQVGFANLITVMNTLDQANNSTVVQSTLASLTPQVDNSISEGAYNITNLSLGTVEGRLSDIRSGQNSGVSSGDGTLDKGVWIQGFGSQMDQDTVGGNAGYDGDVYGVTIGGDKALSDTLRVGLGLSYANSTFDSKANNKELDVDTYQISAYASKTKGKFFLDGLLSAAYNQYESTRTITAVPATARADFDGQTYSARVAAGYNLRNSGGLEITPNVGLTYAYNQTDSYSESGAGGGLDLTVDNDDIQMLRGRAGVDLAYNAKIRNTKVRPQVRVGYEYEILDEDQASTANFTGIATTFRTVGAETDRGRVVAGAGLDISTAKNVTVSADYDYETSGDYNSHNGMLRLRYDF